MKAQVIIKDENDKANVISRLFQMPVSRPVLVELSYYQNKRSTEQNALMWSIYRQMQKHIHESEGNWFSCDNLHEFFKEKYLPTEIIEINGEARKAVKSTKSLKVGEMQEYLELLIVYCSSELGLVLEID